MKRIGKLLLRTFRPMNRNSSTTERQRFQQNHHKNVHQCFTRIPQYRVIATGCYDCYSLYTAVSCNCYRLVQNVMTAVGVTATDWLQTGMTAADCYDCYRLVTDWHDRCRLL